MRILCKLSTHNATGKWHVTGAFAIIGSRNSIGVGSFLFGMALMREFL
jgi:hypothetical protein